MVPMDRSDAKAVRHLLTATQRFAAQAEQARREREEQAGQQQQANHRGDNNRYQYRFDDFENFDQNSDDERDFRDLSHYTTLDTSTGKVTELWLGIINVQAITANNNSGNDDAKHWTLSDDDWEYLSKLDRLEHFKVTGCGVLPHKQLKELRHLKHISCSECGNIAAAGNDGNDQRSVVDLELPQVESISLRCGFQPNPAGIKSLRTMIRYIHNNLTNLERITIWRLDQQLWRGHIATDTTAFQRKQYRRDLVEALLDEFQNNSKKNTKLKTLELNRCGLNSEDFQRLMFEILPQNFPSLQRLSLSSNEIEDLPEIRVDSNRINSDSSRKNVDEYQDDEQTFAEKKHLFRRLRRNLHQIHLSNNPIMDFLGKAGEEHQQLLREEANNDNGEEGNDQERIPDYRYEQLHREEETAIVSRRFRRIKEFEKLRDWLRLFPKLSQLGYVSCVHNMMRSTTEDFIVTSGNIPGGNSESDQNFSVVPFRKYSRKLQQEIEYYLRVNRGGRWLIEGGCYGDTSEELINLNSSRKDLLNYLALWPNILEWSYRTSSSGCFLVPLPPTREHDYTPTEQSAVHLGSQYYSRRTRVPTGRAPSSSHKNATALYRLLREGPALCGQ